MMRWIYGVVAIFALVGLPGGATAQKPSAQKQAAARLLDEGVARYDAGDYQGALEKFRAAYNTYASPKIFLNIGEALRRLHMDVDAAEAYERFLFETANVPEVGDAKKAVARNAMAELRARLGRLRVDVEPPSATVTLDGMPWSPPPGRSVYVQPGRHEISANAPGHLEKRQSVEVAAGQERRIPLNLEVVVAQPAPPVKPQPPLEPQLQPPPAPVAPPEPGAPPPAPTAQGGHLWAWVAAGAAGALLVGGAIFGAKASSDYDEYKSPTITAARYDQLRDAIPGEATTANVLFAGAGAAAVTAGLLWWLEGRGGRERAGTHINVTTGPDRHLGLVASGHF